MTHSRSVVLLSGGPDSMVLVYDLIRQGKMVQAVFMQHGRMRNRHELVASQLLAERLQIPLDVLDLGGIRELRSAYRPGQAISQDPELVRVVDGEDTPVQERLLRQGLSPFSVMLTIALYYTHMVGGTELNIGLIASQTFASPNLLEYLEGLSANDHRLNPRLPKVDIRAPQIEMSKADIIRRGLEMNVPFELSWSCLAGRDLHCGRCTHCEDRRNAFLEVGAPDPTVYAEGPNP